jgi:hypothetical protein
VHSVIWSILMACSWNYILDSIIRLYIEIISRTRSKYNEGQGRKSKVPLGFVNQTSRHEDLWGSITTSLSSALEGAEWSDSCSCLINPTETALGTDHVGGWVDSRACSDVVEKRNCLPPIENQTRALQLSNPSSSRYID